jgi:hypothetical protein
MGKGLVVGLVLALASRSAEAQGISAKYPGDQGIENDSAVVFVEKFDDAGMNTVFSRWQDSVNPGALSLSTDRPPESPGGRSLEMNGNVVRAGYNTSYLYKSFTPEVGDTAYIRYYIKYLNSGPSYHHAGCHFGGYNPPTPWPQGIAGVKPTGSDHFQINTEPFSNNEFGFYSYWMGMSPDGHGDYWGNIFHQAPSLMVNTWFCVEVMVKLNNPVSASNGELAYWINGTKVMHFGPGFPKVTRSGGNWWIDSQGTPFPGFQWRNTLDLKLNFMWIQNDVADRTPPGSLRIDHVVVARSYIGPIQVGPTVNPLPPPTLVSPAQGSSVTGPGVNFTWTPPSGADASTLYQAWVDFPDGTHVEPWFQGVSQGTITLGAPGAYRWLMRSRTAAAGDGPWSAPLNFSLMAPPPPPSPTNGATFVSQSVPSTMAAGGTYAVSVTMSNTGTSTWTAGSEYRLGSQNPQDNQTWGVVRVMLGANESVAPGQSKTFTFNVTAPSSAGTYAFQWRMLQELVMWFGQYSPSLSIAVVSSAPPPPPPAPTGTTGDLTGTYRLVARHSGKVLDVSGISKDNGAIVHQWTWVGGDNQKWKIEPSDSGYYRLTALHSGKVLDVLGASMDDGAQVIQWDWWGGGNQQWKIEAMGGGYYRLLARHSGKALDVSGALTDDGTPVIQWTPNGAENQQWQLVPLDVSTTEAAKTAAGTRAGGDSAQKCGATGAEIWILLAGIAFFRGRNRGRLKSTASPTRPISIPLPPRSGRTPRPAPDRVGSPRGSR